MLSMILIRHFQLVIFFDLTLTLAFALYKTYIHTIPSLSLGKHFGKDWFAAVLKPISEAYKAKSDNFYTWSDLGLPWPFTEMFQNYFKKLSLRAIECRLHRPAAVNGSRVRLWNSVTWMKISQAYPFISQKFSSVNKGILGVAELSTYTTNGFFSRIDKTSPVWNRPLYGVFSPTARMWN